MALTLLFKMIDDEVLGASSSFRLLLRREFI